MLVLQISLAGLAVGGSDAALPDEMELKTYLALDSRNIQSTGDTSLVLGPVRKHAVPVLTETARWEMRFDNMQPNVFYDTELSKWRAWYSTMSECGGNITGPGMDPALPPDCQALPSNCSAAADPTWHWRDIQRAGVFAYAESKDGLAWERPNLNLTEWPEGSGDMANNIVSTFGMGSTGGCGTGILLDTASGAAAAGASGQPEAAARCTNWTVFNSSDCSVYRRGDRPNHTTCGHTGRHHTTPAEVPLAACRAACAADRTCSTIQWQGAAANNFSSTKPGQCNMFDYCSPGSAYSGSHGADWCMEIEECHRDAGGGSAGGGHDANNQSRPKTRFKMFGEKASEPFFGESNDGVTFTNQRVVPIPHGRYDTHKNVVFDPATRKWIGYVRCSPSHNLRVQCYIESKTENFTSTGWGAPMPTGLNSSTFFQPDALVAFHYAPAGVWLGWANVFNPSGPGKGAWRRDGQPGQAPVGQVYGVLAWSPDARHWHYISPEQSFVPLGGGGSTDFDCCGIFMAKQNPVETAEYSTAMASTAPLLPIYYAGSNGAFFGPRAGSLGVAYVRKHAFAGLAGPGEVTASDAIVQTGTLRVTASGAVRVGVTGVGALSVAHCPAIDGTEVEVHWNATKPSSAAGPPLAAFVGGAVGLVFHIPVGSVLFAYHV
jgi:hypothetical protein